VTFIICCWDPTTQALYHAFLLRSWYLVKRLLFAWTKTIQSSQLFGMVIYFLPLKDVISARRVNKQWLRCGGNILCRMSFAVTFSTWSASICVHRALKIVLDDFSYPHFSCGKLMAIIGIISPLAICVWLDHRMYCQLKTHLKRFKR
jgi:hypothetical protein